MADQSTPSSESPSGRLAHWEYQGRQFHGWFGSGTAPPPAPAVRAPLDAVLNGMVGAASGLTHDRGWKGSSQGTASHSCAWQYLIGPPPRTRPPLLSRPRLRRLARGGRRGVGRLAPGHRRGRSRSATPHPRGLPRPHGATTLYRREPRVLPRQALGWRRRMRGPRENRVRTPNAADW